MKKERMLQLAKVGVLTEIERVESRIRKGERILFDRSVGIETKSRKSNEDIKEIIADYEIQLKALKKEFDEIDSELFLIDLV